VTAIRRRARPRRAPPTLTTPRLALRPLERADSERVAALAGDPAVARQLDRVPSPFPTPLAVRWIERRNLRWHRRRGVTLAITQRPERQLIGTVSLKLARGQRHAELGYWLAPDAWGRGIATEAAAALVGWGFEALALDRVHARVLADNPASRRVLDKLGLAVERVCPAEFRRGAALVDVIELGIARAAWLTRPRA
jgi:RimJ/RimL family protein N-acetyltransferase